jgi:hypothetical protein
VSDGRDPQGDDSQYQGGPIEDHWTSRKTPARKNRSRHFGSGGDGSHGPDESVSQVGRVEVESGYRGLMMNSMMLDRVGADRGYDGNPGEHPIDGVVLEVGEPVAELEREVVKKGSGQECQRRVDGHDRGQDGVVTGEENREDPEPAEICAGPRLVVRSSTVEDAVVLDVIPANVPQERKSPVHGIPVHPVLEEIRVENTGDEPHGEDGSQREPKLIESK